MYGIIGQLEHAVQPLVGPTPQESHKWSRMLKLATFKESVRISRLA